MRPHILNCLDVGYTCAIFVTEGYKLGSQVSGSEMHFSGMLFGQTRSVRLVLVLVVMIFMTHRFVCVSCVDSGMFVMPDPTLRAVRTHIGKFPLCLAAGLGVKEV